MKYITEIDSLNGKKVLLRTDFDVPVTEDKKISETYRIQKQKPMIDYLVDNKAVTVLIAHISDEDLDYFNEIIPQLEEILSHKINYLENLDFLDNIDSFESSSVYLLPRIRSFKGEIENDESFAKSLADGFDLYINNDFAVSHRPHASVIGVPKFIPSYAGLLLEDEIKNLGRAVTSSSEGKVIIMGGAKTSTKIPVIKNFMDKAEKLIISGVIANDILSVRGYLPDAENIDENSEEMLKEININDPKLILPVDYKFSDKKVWDIGPNSIELFNSIINKAKMIIWNGPVGYFEKTGFDEGTNAIAQSVASSSAIKIIGGGDTILAIHRIGLLDKFDFVSTGGGAMLAYLAGKKLPGLEALE